MNKTLPYLVNIRPRRQITLPAAILQQLNLTVGDSLALKIEKQKLIASPLQNQIMDVLQAIQKGLQKAQISEKDFQASGQQIREELAVKNYD